MKEVEKMWIDYMTWRQKNDVDHYKVSHFLSQDFYFPQMTELRKIYPHGQHKYDKQVEIH